MQAALERYFCGKYMLFLSVSQGLHCGKMIFLLKSWFKSTIECGKSRALVLPYKQVYSFKNK